MVPFGRDDRTHGSFESAFAVIATASFTFGPVYEIRSRWGHSSPLSEDAWVVAWFCALQAVALMLMLRRPRPAVPRLGGAALIGLGLLLALSSAWAFDPKTTFMQATQLLVTPFFGLYLWSRRSGVWMLTVLWAGTHIGLVWSAWLIWRHEPGSIDHRGNWVGIYLNRNTFTPVAVLGLMTSVALAVTWARSARCTKALLVVALMFGAITADLKLAFESGSRGSLGFAALTAGVVAAVLTLRKRLRHLPEVAAARVVGVTLLIAIATAWLLRRRWAGIFGDDGDFTGRVTGWSVLVDRSIHRPFHGYGYYSLWENPWFALEQAEARMRPLIHAHNSYLEMLLGAGVVALVLCCVVVVSAWRRAFRMVWESHESLYVWPLAIVTYCSLLGLLETTANAHYLFWSLPIGALALQPSRARVHDVEDFTRIIVPDHYQRLNDVCNQPLIGRTHVSIPAQRRALPVEDHVSP
jgi:O-antigen ligase